MHSILVQLVRTNSDEFYKKIARMLKSKVCSICLLSHANTNHIALFYVQQEGPTSTCAALINGNEGHRSMISSLNGANTYPFRYLKQGRIISITVLAFFYVT